MRRREGAMSLSGLIEYCIEGLLIACEEGNGDDVTWKLTRLLFHWKRKGIW